MKNRKRVTVMISTGLDKKLRLIQSEMITQEQKSVSYSTVVNLTLRKAFK